MRSEEEIRAAVVARATRAIKVVQAELGPDADADVVEEAALRILREEDDRRCLRRRTSSQVAYHTHEGVDLLAELHRMRALAPALCRGGIPELCVWRVEGPQRVRGRYRPNDHSVIVVIWPGRSLASARVTLLHEAVHIAIWSGEHGPRFKSAFAEAALTVFGVDVRVAGRSQWARQAHLERLLAPA